MKDELNDTLYSSLVAGPPVCYRFGLRCFVLNAANSCSQEFRIVGSAARGLDARRFNLHP
jgi:hypothetical protein